MTAVQPSLSHDAVVFIFDTLGIPFDPTDRLWFFSDWATGVPRTFEERLWDHCVSHGVYAGGSIT